MNSDNPTNKQFVVPVPGTDPITKGDFLVDWAVVGYEYSDEDEEKVFFAGHITIDKDSNPFYAALLKEPLQSQNHPLKLMFPDSVRFIKIISITGWHNEGDEIVGERLELDVRFEFLDNLGYFEEIVTFKDNNLL